MDDEERLEEEEPSGAGKGVFEANMAIVNVAASAWRVCIVYINAVKVRGARTKLEMIREQGSEYIRFPTVRIVWFQRGSTRIVAAQKPSSRCQRVWSDGSRGSYDE